VRRRDFITFLAGASFAWPLAGRAQQKPMPVIGMLFPSVIRKAFEQGLRDLGYVEGSNVSIEYRATENPDRIAEFAAELVSLKVDVIAAGGSQAVRAAQQATRTIPIVMAASSDPIGSGFVASLAQPGGNITGLSLQTPDASGKRLELLKEVLPGLARVAMLLNPDDPPALLALKETEAAAEILGIKLQVAEVRSPGDFDAAFVSAVAIRPQALDVLSAPIMSTNAGLIAQWAAKEGLPSIFPYKGFPQAGGLMSFGPDLDDLVRRAPIYVDKILKGAKPADLPVQQPTKFELVINLKTAKALGLTVPQSILARADEVIE
jgi:putative tryptophan/tyrosine transport system substrate-binding protein